MIGSVMVGLLDCCVWEETIDELIEADIDGAFVPRMRREYACLTQFLLVAC